MPTLSTTKMSARQFLLMGEDPPGVRLELVDGEIAVSPSPRPRHSFVDTALRSLLYQYVTDNDLGIVIGDVDTIFGEYDVRRPDIIYFRKDRAHLLREDEAIDGPPDLCVEILSPRSETIDRQDKFKQYAAGRVAYYWIVAPKLRTIEAFRLVRGSYRECGRGQGNAEISLPPFADLKLPLGKIWFPSKQK
jgi:Uma2 family endonuclease